MRSIQDIFLVVADEETRLMVIKFDLDHVHVHKFHRMEMNFMSLAHPLLTAHKTKRVLGKTDNVFYQQQTFVYIDIC